MRKEAGLQVEDRIVASASLNAGQARLLERWKDLVQNEIRAEALLLSGGTAGSQAGTGAPQGPGALGREWELDAGEKVFLTVRKAEGPELK
jgi:hypothetical protein